MLFASHTRLGVVTGMIAAGYLAWIWTPHDPYKGKPLPYPDSQPTPMQAQFAKPPALPTPECRQYRTVFQRTLFIDAPIECTFAFFCDFDKLARHVADVRSVHDLGQDRYRCVIIGPAGVTTYSDVQITEIIPNDRISWRSCPSSLIPHQGSVRFQEMDNGTTQVDIEAYYTPLVDKLARTAAMVLGTDPEQDINTALMRIKLGIELESRFRKPAKSCGSTSAE